MDENERLEDLKKLRELTNNSPYLAYPFGQYSEYSIELLQKAGIRMAFTTKNGRIKVGDYKYSLPRNYVFNEFDIEKFKEIIKPI